MIRILLVDDHASAREPLALLLEREPDMAVVGQAGSLAEARTILARTGVDIAIVDLGLPDGDGVELIRDLRATNPYAAVLVLTAQTDRRRWAQAVEAGASGVLEKSAPLREVLDAPRKLAEGKSLLSARELRDLLDLLQLAGRERDQSRDAGAALARLTPREREVLQGIAEGLSDKEIAARLFISGKTVRAHVASILAKLGVDSRLQALIFAVRHGAVEIH